MFFAVLHDNTLTGDNLFYANEFVPYKASDTKENLVGRLVKVKIGIASDASDVDPEVVYIHNDLMNSVEGAWIISEETRQVINVMYKDNWPTGDSAVYMMNKAAKNICELLAIKNLHF